MCLDIAWQKFFKAVHGGVTCDEPSLQRRLACIYEYDIAGLPNNDGRIPAKTWGRIRAFDVLARGEGVKATTNAMTTTEAAKWLHEVVEIFYELSVARTGGKPTNHFTPSVVDVRKN